MEDIMAQVMTFPSELKNHFFRDADLSFLIIWAATFLMINSTVFYLQSLPLRPITESEIADYTKAIFRVRFEKNIKSTIEPDVSGQTTDQKIVEIEDENQAIEVKKDLSIAEKRTNRESKKAERTALADEKRRQIARKILITTGPTVKNSGITRSGESLMTASGMVGSGVSDIDLKNTLAFVTDANTSERVKSARDDGMVSGDIGDISLSEMKNFIKNKTKLLEVLNESSLEMPEKVFISKGKGKHSSARREGISRVVNANKNQVQYCYWTFKRKDPNLKGQVIIKFTINASGVVTRVWFENSQWGGNPYRKSVEKAIQNVIMQWKFETSDPTEGDITAGATFIFE
jgi:hypothetical protein